MSLGRKDISNNIATKTLLSLEDSKIFFNTFINIIKTSSISKTVKISNFGSFQRKITPSRLGRNPISKEEYIISERRKLILKPSNVIKNFLN